MPCRTPPPASTRLLRERRPIHGLHLSRTGNKENAVCGAAGVLDLSHPQARHSQQALSPPVRDRAGSSGRGGRVPMSAATSLTSGRVAGHIRRLSSFSFIGGLVTLVSTGLNIVLLKYFQTPLFLTWVCVYCTAIVVSYLLNSRFTFRSALAAHRLVLYFGVYLASLGLGVVLLKIYRTTLSYPDWVRPLLVLPFTALFNYSLSSAFMPRSTR